jgi:hypothetical protein
MTAFSRSALRIRRRALVIWTPIGFLVSILKLWIWPLGSPQARAEYFGLPYFSWIPDSMWLDSLAFGLCLGGFMFLLVCAFTMPKTMADTMGNILKALAGFCLYIGTGCQLFLLPSGGLQVGIPTFVMTVAGVVLFLLGLYIAYCTCCYLTDGIRWLYYHTKDRQPMLAIIRWLNP